jgi:hypothetical protein
LFSTEWNLRKTIGKEVCNRGLGLSDEGGCKPQKKEQMSGTNLHVFTLRFLALKKSVFSLFQGQNFF